MVLIFLTIWNLICISFNIFFSIFYLFPEHWVLKFSMNIYLYWEKPVWLYVCCCSVLDQDKHCSNQTKAKVMRNQDDGKFVCLNPNHACSKNVAILIWLQGCVNPFKDCCAIKAVPFDDELNLFFMPINVECQYVGRRINV